MASLRPTAREMDETREGLPLCTALKIEQKTSEAEWGRKKGKGKKGGREGKEERERKMVWAVTRQIFKAVYVCVKHSLGRYLKQCVLLLLRLPLDT